MGRPYSQVQWEQFSGLPSSIFPVFPFFLLQKLLSMLP